MTERTAESTPPIAEVVPHRGRALLLDRIETHETEMTCCVVEIDASTWLRRADGTVPAWIGIEYMAQCIAAHEGCVARETGRKLEPGFLVRARRVRFHHHELRAGERLAVRVRRLRGRPALGAMAYACEIRAGARPEAPLVAEAQLTVALGRAEASPLAGRRRSALLRGGSGP